MAMAVYAAHCLLESFCWFGVVMELKFFIFFHRVRPTMGCCFGVPGRRRSSHRVPLKQEPLTWRSEVAVTTSDLERKRSEFWETAPLFGGRPEVWSALRAACSSFEGGDFTHCQAILDSAAIRTPCGNLTEAFDEFGARYEIPLYCVSRPENLSVCSAHVTEAKWGCGCGRDAAPGPGLGSSSGKRASESSEEEVILKCRVSLVDDDYRLSCPHDWTIRQAKVKLAQSMNWSHETRQRWFYGGKLIPDHIQLEETRIPKNHVVQVVVCDPTSATCTQ